MTFSKSANSCTTFYKYAHIENIFKKMYLGNNTFYSLSTIFCIE